MGLGHGQGKKTVHSVYIWSTICTTLYTVQLPGIMPMDIHAPYVWGGGVWGPDNFLVEILVLLSLGSQAKLGQLC